MATAHSDGTQLFMAQLRSPPAGHPALECPRRAKNPGPYRKHGAPAMSHALPPPFYSKCHCNLPARQNPCASRAMVTATRVLVTRHYREHVFWSPTLPRTRVLVTADITANMCFGHRGNVTATRVSGHIIAVAMQSCIVALVLLFLIAANNTDEVLPSIVPYWSTTISLSGRGR